MPRKSLEHEPCSWARGATAVCDQWSILIIRDAFRGVRTFSAFMRSTGMSKNVLARRLSHLVEHGIITKRSIGVDTTATEYRLTEKGESLFPMMVALAQWSDAWNFDEADRPPKLVDTFHGKPIQNVTVLARDGRELSADQVSRLPEPAKKSLD